MSEATQKITQDDIDAAWQFVVAAAPQLVANNLSALQADERLVPNLALRAMQAHLALRMRLGVEFIPVRKDWADAVKDLPASLARIFHRRSHRCLFCHFDA